MGFIFGRKSTGWKKAAKINCILLVFMSAIFIVLLSLFLVRAGSIDKALFLYEDKCQTGNSSYVNVLLHILINVISTAVVSQALVPRKVFRVLYCRMQRKY